MKNKINLLFKSSGFSRIALFTLTIGMLVYGCSKNEVSEPYSKIKDHSALQKSGTSNIEYLGMAANIDTVDFKNGEYEVTFYNHVSIYTVEIEKWDPGSLIELSIAHGVLNSIVVIDFDREMLEIENDDDYTFSDLENRNISPSSSYLLRVVSIVLAQHIENPYESIGFSDNGNSDYFPNEEVPEYGCCFCKTRVQVPICCNTCHDWVTVTVFWLWQSSSFGEPYNC
jgi:hypothetical protein